MKKQKAFNRNVLKNNFWLFGFIWKYTPGYIISACIFGILWGFKHSIEIIYMKELFDALDNSSSFKDIARVILSYAIFLLVFWIYHQWYIEIYGMSIREKLHIKMHNDMFKKAVSLDIEKYDDPVFYNDFVWSMEQATSQTFGLVENTEKLLNRIVALITTSGIIFSVDKQMAVIVFAASLMRTVFGILSNKMWVARSDEINPIYRKNDYIKRVFKLPDFAKELRISHVSENLFNEFSNNTEKQKEVLKKYGKKTILLYSVINSIGTLCESFVIIMMLYKVMVSKEATLGSFAVGVSSCWSMSWLLHDMIDRTLNYHKSGLFIEKMKCFMECEPKIKGGNLIAEDFSSLKFSNVSFSYGEQDKDALREVSFEIKRGERIAIVGYNGAGKTTLTKLLMRLYDPSSGEIFYNGKNLREYSIYSLRNKIAAVFQDYRIIAGSVAENVVAGEYNDNNRERVEAALKKSTFSEKLSTLKGGINTPLTREFDDSGTLLSGGEQQKIAIARAFYKDAEIIILDEPSAALDPHAEYELNRSISEYAENKTVIFISHRLSTTRHVDKIYMFSNGAIIESGSHDQLMEQNGEYAHMFNLQSEKYKENY